jgi:hypothetical protein
MGKRSHRDAEIAEKKPNGATHTNSTILTDDKAVDPSLALLFASSVCFPCGAQYSCIKLKYTYRQGQFKRHPKLVMNNHLELRVQFLR